MELSLKAAALHGTRRFMGHLLAPGSCHLGVGHFWHIVHESSALCANAGRPQMVAQCTGPGGMGQGVEVLIQLWT